MSRILNGRMRPLFATVVRLAEVLGVRVGWLLDEHDGPTLSLEDAAALRRGMALLEKIAAPDQPPLERPE